MAYLLYMCTGAADSSNGYYNTDDPEDGPVARCNADMVSANTYPVAVAFQDNPSDFSSVSSLALQDFGDILTEANCSSIASYACTAVEPQGDPFVLSVQDAGAIAVAIIGVWTIGWAFRMLASQLRSS